MANNREFPKVHDLLALNTLCEQAGILTGLDPARLDVLSADAVRIRYPGDDPTPDEAREAVKIARSIAGWSEAGWASKSEPAAVDSFTNPNR